MDKSHENPTPLSHSYSLRRSTIYAKDHLYDIESDVQSISNADSSYSLKHKRRHGKKIKKSKKTKRLAETSESEDEQEEEQGIEPSPLDIILLNKLPVAQKDLKAFKIELDKHIQKYRTLFFQEIQNNKRELNRN